MPGRYSVGSRDQKAKPPAPELVSKAKRRARPGNVGTSMASVSTILYTSHDDARDIPARYDSVKGSAVNPVLRQGNSDRRAPASVKNYARSHPHSMGAWSSASKTNVAHMTADDFRSTERSVTMPKAGSLRIELVGADGAATPLRPPLAVEAGEVIDAAVMRVAALDDFLADQMVRAKE